MKAVLVDRTMHKVYQEDYECIKQVCDLKIISSDKKADVVLKELGSPFSDTINVRYKGLFKTLIKLNPDVVIIRTYYRLFSISAILYSLLFFKKLIIIEEQNQHPKGWLKNLFFQIYCLPILLILHLKSAKTICITKLSFKLLNDLFPNCVFIPTACKPKIERKHINVSGDNLKIICVSRLVKHKGIDLLIKAVAKLPKNTKLTIVGKGDMKKELEKLAEDLGVAANVEFKGWVDNTKIDEIYRKHNLFVLPSYEEPVGMVVLEAMSNGLPCIVSERVGASNPGTIEFKPGDVDSLVYAIHSLGNSEVRQRFTKASFEVFCEYFNPERIKELYKGVILNGK